MTFRVVICRSNPIAPDPRVEKEANTLSNCGYSVSVVGWDRTSQLSEYEEREGIRIYRLAIQAEFARGIRNLPALLRWQTRLLSWLIRNRADYDLIHACDFDTVLPAMICKTLLGKYVIYDIFDFYADHLRATPEAIKKAIRFIDLKIIDWVDGVILADDSRKKQIRGTNPNAMEVIYNSPQDIYGVLCKNEQKRRNGELHLAYIGLLQKERGLLELIEVLSHHPEWKLDLAGFGGDEKEITSLANKLANITAYGRIQYDQAIALSAKADVLIATYDPTIPNHRFSSPNKVFEAMMLGKPIIVARNTNMDQMIEEAQCGIIVNYGDMVELEATLSQLALNPSLRLQLGQNGRKAYETSYHWSIMETRLLGLYAEISGSA